MGRMRRLLKFVVLPLLVLVLVAAGGLWGWSHLLLTRTWSVTVAPVEPARGDLALARGAHLVRSRGCLECHAGDLGGRAMMDNGAMGRVVAGNLTRGRGGLPGSYRPVDWDRAIRHGLGRDGRALLLMPSHDYWHLGDQDLAAMIAWLDQAPPVDRELPASAPGPVMRLLLVTGRMGLAAARIDHAAARPPVPPFGVNPDYGAYIARVSCVSCHGADMRGGPIPGGDPRWPPAADLGFGPGGIEGWVLADFQRALRERVDPHGRALDPAMPRHLAHLGDLEIGALWAWLKTLGPRAEGDR